jgi:hypothetical protein
MADKHGYCETAIECYKDALFGGTDLCEPRINFATQALIFDRERIPTGISEELA